ncbi:MAG: diaminopimelate decarboxylase [Candidatus Saganbacteria bacterium]|uniref:Diaminopimelate decarboxylase n=1 Tax=Candidatus Saganbacteria bacterium TaxID=2575572 RepID=A0A833L0S0_UNCSA|nr:MAG: diaminopimelate decarboxylase [Candidatus Saganbacteria bacterium]
MLSDIQIFWYNHNMNQPITSKVNEKGHLEIGGCDLADLAAEFGTPLYVLDEVTIRSRCREYKTAFKGRYDNTLIIYACKALCNTAVLKLLSDEGIGFDVSSGGELYIARKANCDLKNIYFHGNNKSKKELEEAVDLGVGRVVVDNFDELKALDAITQKAKKKADILFRINPGIEAHTHEFIQTGQIDSKFGIAKEKAIDAVKLAAKMKYVKFVGLHSHIGSQIFDIKPYIALVELLCDLAGSVLAETGIKCEDINIGGGIGIDYTGQDNVISLDAVASEIVEVFKNKSQKLGAPKLILEPGRSIIGTAGVTLYSIGSIKDIPEIRKYIAVDGGMSDNPRPILYGAVYDALLANKANAPKTEKVTVAGRFCESGDRLIKDIELPKAEIGDILCVFCTGAYNYSMASNYNRVGRPAMVLVNNGISSLILKREAYEDLIANDVVL